MGKTCEPSDERSYDAPYVSYTISIFSLIVVFQVVSPILFFNLTITSLYFLQTNYYTQIYQFNLLLTSYKLARKINLSILVGLFGLDIKYKIIQTIESNRE
jgi:hypothetical protein